MTMLHFTNHSIPLRWLTKSFLLAIFGTFLISGFFVGCGQQGSNKPTDFIDIWRVGDKAIPAAVYIEVIDREKPDEPLPAFTADPFFSRYFDVGKLRRKFSDELGGEGTGMIIDSQGHILTNNHVVRGATMIEVRLANGKWCPAKLIGTDPETDLAVIRISNQVALPHVIFGDSDILEEGEPVAAVGYMGRIREAPIRRMTPAVFAGRIKATHPDGIAYWSSCPDFCSSDVSNNPGNSGGLLLNRQGEVIGIELATVIKSNETQTIGFAIPSNTAVNIAEKLISHGLEGA